MMLIVTREAMLEMYLKSQLTDYIRRGYETEALELVMDPVDMTLLKQVVEHVPTYHGGTFNLKVDEKSCDIRLTFKPEGALLCQFCSSQN